MTSPNRPPERPFVQAAAFNRKHWQWFLGIFVLEFWLAYSLSPTVLDTFPFLKLLVAAVGAIAPVVHNFGAVVTHPEALSLFFAVTTLLIIPKAAFFFIWLNSSRLAMYRHFVISPLTRSSTRSPVEFSTEPLHDEKRRDEKPRSAASRFVFSLLIILILGLLTFVILNFGWQLGERPQAAADDLKALTAGGWPLWLHWSVKWATLAALFSAIVACVVRDYIIFFANITGLGRSRP